MRRRPPTRTLLLLLLAITVYAGRELGWLEGVFESADAPASVAAGAGEARLLEAWEQRKSGVVVEISGRIEKVLADDRRGSRHQRFILGLPSGHTVLVTHNIDLAPRIDGLTRSDPVTLRGQYEWNERGGVVHWTHHDPRGEHPGGWLEHGGRRYE